MEPDERKERILKGIREAQEMMREEGEGRECNIYMPPDIWEMVDKTGFNETQIDTLFSSIIFGYFRSMAEAGGINVKN